MCAMRNAVAAAALICFVAAPGWAAGDQGNAAPANPPTAAPGWSGPNGGPPPWAGRGMMGMMGAGPRGFAGPGWGYGMGAMMGGMFGFADEGQVIEFVDGRLAFLRAELRITEPQMPLWNSFAEAVRANATAVNQRRVALFNGDWTQKSLPDRLDAEEKALQARLDAFRAASAALKPLYAAFDEAQKKTADVLLVSPMGHLRGFM